MNNPLRLVTPFTRLALASALAAGAAYTVTSLIPNGYVAPVPSAIAAVAVTSTTAARAWKVGFLQVIGISVGAVIALAAVHFIGYSAITVTLLVLSSFILVNFLKRVRGISPPEAATSIAVSIILVMGSHFSTSDALARFLGVLVGAVIGLLGSLFVSTNATLYEITDEIDELRDEVSELASDIALGLSKDVNADVDDWNRRALEIRTKFRDDRKLIKEIESSSKISPLIGKDESEALRKRYDALGMTITRLVTVTSDLKAAHKRNVLDEAPTAVLTPLAQLFKEVSATLDTDREPLTGSDISGESRRALREAANAGMETVEIAMISGIAANARGLVPMDDTQIIDMNDPEED